MQNNFNAFLYEDSGGWIKVVRQSSALGRSFKIFMFTTYCPWMWQVVEQYGPMTAPAFPGGLNMISDGVSLRFDLGGAGIIVPDAIPDIGEQSMGPTVTNGVQVQGYYATFTVPGRNFVNGGAGADYSLSTWGQCPGGTVQSQNFHGKTAAAVHRAAIIPETEYTQAIQDAGNTFPDAGPTLYHVCGLWA